MFRRTKVAINIRKLRRAFNPSCPLSIPSVKNSCRCFFWLSLVFAVYAPSLRNGFVWDDTALILRDPLIRSWRLIPEGFQHFLFTDAARF